MTQLYGRFTKQSSETQDYDIDLTDWFSNRTDEIAEYDVTVPDGIVDAGSSNSSTVVRLALSGGTDGEKYKITVLVTTTSSPPVIKEVDFIVVIKDV